MDDDKSSLFPPERFANLLRDSGINSPEALARALRMGEETNPAEELEGLSPSKPPRKTEAPHQG